MALNALLFLNGRGERSPSYRRRTLRFSRAQRLSVDGTIPWSSTRTLWLPRDQRQEAKRRTIALWLRWVPELPAVEITAQWKQSRAKSDPLVRTMRREAGLGREGQERTSAKDPLPRKSRKLGEAPRRVHPSLMLVLQGRINANNQLTTSRHRFLLRTGQRRPQRAKKRGKRSGEAQVQLVSFDDLTSQPGRTCSDATLRQALFIQLFKIRLTSLMRR